MYGISGNNKTVARSHLGLCAIYSENKTTCFDESRLNMWVMMQLALSALLCKIERNHHEVRVVGQNLSGNSRVCIHYWKLCHCKVSILSTNIKYSLQHKTTVTLPILPILPILLA